jgi:hypothetical protein
LTPEPLPPCRQVVAGAASAGNSSANSTNTNSTTSSGKRQLSEDGESYFFALRRRLQHRAMNPNNMNHADASRCPPTFNQLGADLCIAAMEGTSPLLSSNLAFANHGTKRELQASGPNSGGIPVTTTTLPSCDVLKAQRSLKMAWIMNNVFAETAKDAYQGCSAMLKSMLTFTTENVTSVTTSCQWDDSTPEFKADPCCNQVDRVTCGAPIVVS